MKNLTMMQIVQALKSFGFEDVEYCKKTKQFSFHNNSDIMNNYVTIVYSKAFQKFNVCMHPIETSNIMELQEVAKRLEMCTLLVERLNQILNKQLQTDTKKLVMHL